jgi:hypothetical protein
MRNIALIITFLILTSCNRTFITQVNTRRTNILYAEVDNVIEINTNSKKEITATIDNGKIEKREPRVYIIKVNNLLPTILTIKQGSTESKFEFKTKQYQIQKFIFDSKMNLHIKTNIQLLNSEN